MEPVGRQAELHRTGPLSVSQMLPLGRTVGWQEHSKNDLRAWPQLLRKGGRNFKIDLNWQRQPFCALQQRVANKSDVRGCFVLNHDTPNLTMAIAVTTIRRPTF